MGFGPADFEKVEQIGRGGQATVWLARVIGSDGDLVALKETKLRFMDSSGRRRAQQEVTLLRELSSKQQGDDLNIVVRYLGCFEDDAMDTLVLVLEFIDGLPLHKAMAQQPQGHFSESRARTLLAVIAGTLGKLHNLGIVYRDLKLPNLLLCPGEGGQLRLVDFGYAKKMQQEEPVSVGMHRLRRTYSIVGTFYALAPEMLECREEQNTDGFYEVGHGEMVDWWQLGIVACELLYGRPPWGYQDEASVKVEARKSPASLEGVIPTDGEAGALIRALLEADPLQRLGVRGDAEEVLAHPFFQGLVERVELDLAGLD
ncbi:unnamed protein product [Polarella glacialis]|uniref:Protein kinase domain-containing protein n=1 Tax=Polarella glacialis TaxID=89957 RepID=A0A813LWP0_POLGL|nr:unnamed protein product [Polarella glacialis]